MDGRPAGEAGGSRPAFPFFGAPALRTSGGLAALARAKAALRTAVSPRAGGGVLGVGLSRRGGGSRTALLRLVQRKSEQVPTRHLCTRERRACPGGRLCPRALGGRAPGRLPLTCARGWGSGARGAPWPRWLARPSKGPLPAPPAPGRDSLALALLLGGASLQLVQTRRERCMSCRHVCKAEKAPFDVGVTCRDALRVLPGRAGSVSSAAGVE